MNGVFGRALNQKTVGMVSPPPGQHKITHTIFPVNSHQLPQLQKTKKIKNTINHLSKMDCPTPRTRRLSSTSSDADPSPTDLEPNPRLFEHLNLSTSLPDLNQELRRMLSLHSEITTSSLSTTEHHPKAQAGEEKPFRKIGAGACGAVFAQDGVAAVVKLAKSDDHLELWNDYLKHTAIAAKIQRYAKFGRYSRRINDVRIPACHYFVPKERTTWFDHHHGLGKAAEQIVNLPTAALVTERITPLPLSIRTKLVEKYCADRIKKAALADPANQDCLVRVYLGSKKGKSGQAFFSLRNFKLHQNQMVELGLDVETLAKSMGKALATMHWAARTDARDVEFVLGVSSGDTSKALTSEQLEDLPPCTYTGRIELFVLDFNQVRSITLDEAGVALAVEAVRLNDPYYPTPVPSRTLKSVEQQVWEAFSRSYLVASYEILMEELGYGSWLSLPRKFISGLWEGIETTKIMQMTDYNYEF